MRSSKTALLAITIATLMGVLSGCDSSRSTGDSSGDGASSAPLGVDAENRRYVGADACIACHAGYAWSVDAVTDYLAGQHVVHSTNVDASMAGEGCLVCHDPVGDGRRLAGLIAKANVPAAGLAAVTCEACHGAGGDHVGVGGSIAIPVLNPDIEVCGNCHNDSFDTSTSGHVSMGDHILEDYKASLHYTQELRNDAICVKCHTDEGGRLYKGLNTWAALADTQPIDGAHPIQCRTCHNAHNPGALLKAASTASAEYNTCTNCHQPHDAQVTEDPHPDGTGDGNSGDLIYHAKRWGRVISSTHYDNPATLDVIEGYTMDPANEHVCRDCHNVHTADITINQQWSRSGHGGELFTLKEAAAALQPNNTFAEVQAVRAAGPHDNESAFLHYNWDATYKADGSDEGTAPDLDRGACQRCHTATGAKNYMTDQAHYDPANNDFSHLDGWQLHNDTTGATVASGQNEMLYCWACHADNAGSLRNPGAITAPYTDAPHIFPDALNSNLCVACHTGRESCETIKNNATVVFNNKSFISSHYLSAGGTVFTATGYEFDADNHPSTDDYANPEYYAHDQIGMGTDARLAAFEATNGTKGPCIGCHLSSPEGHLYLPVTKDAGGVITAITATVCVSCHTGGFALTPAVLIEQEEGFDAAMAALSANLATRGYDFLPDYPYFTNKDWTLTGDATGKKDMGAAFNYNTLKHDPGAFAHNRFYAQRLIFDSIDWLDNRVMDGTIDLSIYPVAAEYFQEDGNVANDSAVTRP